VNLKFPVLASWFIYLPSERKPLYAIEKWSLGLIFKVKGIESLSLCITDLKYNSVTGVAELYFAYHLLPKN
jgi:hypothetical protein